MSHYTRDVIQAELFSNDIQGNEIENLDVCLMSAEFTRNCVSLRKDFAAYLMEFADYVIM